MFSYICKSLELLLSGPSPLLAAVEKNDVESVIQIIEAKSNLEIRYNKNLPDLITGDCYVENGTAIHLAVGNNNLTILEILLKYKANINAKDSYGRTPLIKAVEEDSNYSIISKLLDAKANINERDNQGQTVLHKTTLNSPSCEEDRAKKLHLIKSLLKRKIYINQVDNQGKSALMNFLEIMTPSIRQGYDSFYLESVGGFLLILPNIIELFLNYGADVVALKDNQGENVVKKAENCRKAFNKFNSKNKEFYPELREYYENYPILIVNMIHKHLDILRLRTFALGVRYDKATSPTKILGQGDVPEILSLIFDFMKHKKINKSKNLNIATYKQNRATL